MKPSPLEELRSVRADGEIGHLANRAIAGDKLDVPILGLAISAVGVAIRALKNASILRGHWVESHTDAGSSPVEPANFSSKSASFGQSARPFGR